MQPRAPRLATSDPQRLRHLWRRREIVVLTKIVDPAPRLLRLLRRQVVAAGDPRAAMRHQLADPVARVLHQVRADHAAPEPGRRHQPELDRRGEHRLAHRLVLRERQPIDLEQARQVVLARRRVDPLERRQGLRRAHQVAIRSLRQRVLRRLQPLLRAHPAQRLAGAAIRVRRELAGAELPLRRLEAQRRVALQALRLDLSHRRPLPRLVAHQQLQPERLRQLHEDLIRPRRPDVDHRVDHRHLAEIRRHQPDPEQRIPEPAQQHRPRLQRRRSPHLARRLVEQRRRRHHPVLEAQIADHRPLDLRAQRRPRAPPALPHRPRDPGPALVARRRRARPRRRAREPDPRLQQPVPDHRRPLAQLLQVPLQRLQQLPALMRRQHQRRLLLPRQQLEPRPAPLRRPLTRLAASFQRPRLTQTGRQLRPRLRVDPAPAGHRAVRAAGAGIRHLDAPAPLVDAAFHARDHSLAGFSL